LKDSPENGHHRRHSPDAIRNPSPYNDSRRSPSPNAKGNPSPYNDYGGSPNTVPEPRDSPNYGGPESPMHEQYRRLEDIYLSVEVFVVYFIQPFYICLICLLFKMYLFVILQPEPVTPCRRMISVVEEKA
jgi:hypothetical protein